MSVNVGKAVAYLDIDTSRFRSGLKSAKSDLQGFGDSSKTAGDKMKSLGSGLTTIGSGLTKGVTAPLVGVGAASLKTAYDFEKQMARVKSISGATGDDFKRLEAKAKEMGATTVFTSKDAADALEYMGMAGWKTDDMISGLPGIMNLAAASGEELGSVSDIVTDALTGFGLTAKDTSRFVDVLAAASTNSNTNVGLMGETFKYAAPVAGAFGYSIEDTAVAIGLMANSGIKASQSGTALRTLMTNMANPTDKMISAMKTLGISLTNTDGSAKSFKEIMDDLRKGFGNLKMPQEEVKAKMEELNAALESGKITEDEYNKSMEQLAINAYGVSGAEKAKAAAMLAGKTGMSGLLAIVNASEQDYKKLTDAIYGSEGAAQKMADTQKDTLWGSFELLKSAISAVAQSIGERLIPYVRKLADWLTGLVDKFNKLSDEQKDFIVKIGLIVAAVGPALLIIGKFVTAIGTIISTFGTLFKAGKTIVSGISTLMGVGGKLVGLVTKVGGALAGFIVAHPVVAAVGAIIAILVTLYAKCEWFRDGVNKIAGFLKDLPGKIVDFFKGLPDKIGGLIEGAKKKAEELVKPFKELPGKIKQKFDDGVDSIQGFGDGIVTKFDEGFGDFTEKTYNSIDGWGKEVKGKFYQAAYDSLGENSPMWLTFKGLGDLGGGLSTTMGGVWQSITDGAMGVGDALIHLVTLNPKEAWNDLRGAFQRFKDRDLESLKKGFSEMKKGAKEAFEGLKNTAKEKLCNVGKSIKDTFKDSPIGKFAKTAGDKMGEVKDKIKGAFSEESSIGGFFKSVGDKFSGLKSDAGDKLGKVGGKLSEMNKQVSEDLPGAFQGVFTEKIPGFFDSVGTKAGEVGQSIKDFFSQSPEEMGRSVGEMAGNIVNFFTDSGDKVMTFVTETIPEKWGQFSEWFATNIGGFFENLGENIGKVGEKVADFFKGIPEKISGAFDSLGELYDEFNTWCGEVAEKLGEWLGTLVGNIYLFFTEDIPNAWNKFWNSIPIVLKKIEGFFDLVWVKIKDFFKKAWDKFTTWIDNLWTKVGELGSKLWTWVTTEIPKIIGKVVDFFKELPGKIKDSIDKAWSHFKKWGKKMWDKAAETGEKVVDGLFKFFKELPGKIKDAVGKAYDKVTDWGKKMLKKAKDIGKNFVKNLVDYFKELPGKILDFIKSIPKKIVNLKDKFVNAGKKIFSGLWDGLKGVWDSITKWLNDIWDNLGKFTDGFKKGFNDTVNSKAGRAVNGSHAGGLSYVPFNGYVAELHEGERVLTADENEAYSGGSQNGGDIFNFYNTRPEPYEYYREMKKAKRELAYGI